MTTDRSGEKNATWLRLGTRLAVLAAILLLYHGIDTGSLIPSDDSIYTRAAIEGARAGRVIDVTWMGHVLFEKGPLLFGAIQLSGLAGGPIEQQARFPGVLAGVLILLLVYRISRDLGLSVPAALVSAAFCLSTNLFFFNARRPLTDTPGIMLALAGLRTYLAWPGSRRRFLAGVLFGLSSLFKFIAPVPFIAAAMVISFFRDRRGVPVRTTAAGAGWCLAGLAVTILPWHVAMIAVHGQAFMDTYFGYHLFQRVTESVEGATAGDTYTGWLMTRDPGASIVLLATLPASIVLAVKRDAGALAALTITGLACLLPAVSSTALPHYILPAVPGLALAVGVCADRLIGLCGKTPALRMAASLTMLAGAGVIFASSNLEDMKRPDYSHDSKALCEVMRSDGSAARIAGTFDLHDTAVPLYCDMAMKFYGYHPGYHAAVHDTPMLEGTYERFGLELAGRLADTGETLVCDSNGLAELKDIASREGLLTQVREFGTRYAFSFVRR